MQVQYTLAPLIPPYAPSLIARFWSKVRRTPACWYWDGLRGRHGYGVFGFSVGRGEWKQCRAHRLSFELANGPIPTGMVIRHRCDNPRCVNPAHLMLGTQAENVADMISRRRNATGDRSGSRAHPERRPRGVAHAATTLGEGQVRQLRREYAAGARQVLLARKYGISQSTVSNIILRRTWQHLE